MPTLLSWYLLANSSLCCVIKCKNKTKQKRFFTIRFVVFSWKLKNPNRSVILKICRIGSVVFSFSDIWEDVSFDTDELQRKSGETFLERKYEISSFAIFLKRYVSLFQEKQNAYILGVFKKCNPLAVIGLKVALLSWGKMQHTMYVIRTCQESTKRWGCCFWSCSLLLFRTIAISSQFITSRRSFVTRNRQTGVTEGGWGLERPSVNILSGCAA